MDCMKLHIHISVYIYSASVFCRVRPLSKKNIADGAKAAVGFPSDTDISVDVGGKMAAFQFDRVFDSSSTQEQVFVCVGEREREREREI